SSSVSARHFDVTKVRLPGITPSEASRYESLVESEAANWDLSGSLEELRAGLASAEKESASVADLDTVPPRVVFAQSPAILVGYELLYVTNTESDVVREVSTQAVYILLAGRWYRAATTAGPWTFVRGDRMPASFSRIPPESPKANLLASVAGTDQADDAVADA